MSLRKLNVIKIDQISLVDPCHVYINWNRLKLLKPKIEERIMENVGRNNELNSSKFMET